jgi:hypothetical protein
MRDVSNKNTKVDRGGKSQIKPVTEKGLMSDTQVEDTNLARHI